MHVSEKEKPVEEIHPILRDLSLAFWETRLLVEREGETLPLKLLILSIVCKEKGVHPGEVCGRLGLEFSRVTRLLQSLEKEGLLCRERDGADRRFLHLYPTEKGREALRERTAVVNERLLDRLGGRLSPEELKELERMLRLMAEAMKPRNGGRGADVSA